MRSEIASRDVELKNNESQMMFALNKMKQMEANYKEKLEIMNMKIEETEIHQQRKIDEMLLKNKQDMVT